MLLTFWAGIFKFYRIQIDLNETTNSQRHQATNFVSLGITVVYTRIWGYERAYARSYPQIRTLSRQSLKNRKSLDICSDKYARNSKRLHFS
jgi:hypothetical protein